MDPLLVAHPEPPDPSRVADQFGDDLLEKMNSWSLMFIEMQKRLLREPRAIPSLLRQRYIENKKLRYVRCIEPTGRCNREPVRAHSIPNSGVLDRLSQDGHVVMPQETIAPGGIPLVQFARVGRSRASTFTGLCGEHDNSIFQPIDADLSDVPNSECLFLLAYRAVFRETHVCVESACRLQAAYLEMVARGASSSQEPDVYGVGVYAQLLNAFECEEYKAEFDRSYLNHDFGAIVHKVIRFEKCAPSIAVNSLFSLEDVALFGSDVAQIALNIFPTDDGTSVVFSFLSRHAPRANQYLQRVLLASGAYQKYLVSRIVLQHCDNFVISPSFYDRLGESQKARLLDFFTATLLENRPDYEHEDLFLF